MTPPLHRPQPAPRAATPADLRRWQNFQELLRGELPRVREAALAWRNGLAALLASLVGFGLVKGRSDISELASRWAVTVGWLLLGALLAGLVGAMSLLRAAHGRPRVVRLEDTLPRPLADHHEAMVSARSLHWGIVFTVLCAGLLVAAVAATWYGPDKEPANFRFTSPGQTVCGTIARIDHGRAFVTTDDGEVAVDLAAVSSMASVGSCSGAS